MKLSLQMIADQLEEYEPFLHIQESDNTLYRSSRLFRSEGNLYVAQMDEHTCIYGCYPDSYILLKNIQEEQVQNKVLDIFDQYASWMEEIELCLENGNYQKVVDICFEIFRDPVFILGQTAKLIALTKKIDKNALNNPEWVHLADYGYSSLQNYEKFKGALNKQALHKNSEPVYYKNPPTSDRTCFMVSMLCHQQTIYGRITVMEYFRKLTPGDTLLLKYISDRISRHMHYQSQAVQKWEGSSIFLNLLLHKKISQEEMLQLKQFYSWTGSETYRICVLEYADKSAKKDLAVMEGYCEKIFRHCPVAICEDRVVAILDQEKTSLNLLLEKIQSPYMNELDIKMGISLEFRDLHQAHSFYQQAIFALSQSKSSKEKYEMFYDCAIEYLILCNDLKNKKSAIHPDIARLIEKAGIRNNETLHTLYQYLTNERSLIKASDAMHIHRNTLLYRINKITEEITYDLSNSYTREYMILSIIAVHILNKVPENCEI